MSFQYAAPRGNEPGPVSTLGGCPSELYLKLTTFNILYFRSTQVGLIFVFNLIVGTGALTLPADIAKAGWLFGIFFIVVLAFISYMTVTFVIETMACANAVIHWRRLQLIKRDNVDY